jgi:hypothetical protein
MTYINVTSTQAEIVLTDASGAVTAITTPSAPQILTAVTEGPLGPQGPPAPVISSIGQISDVDTSAVTDGSVLVYNGTVSKFTADSVWTTTSLTDGGNF